MPVIVIERVLWLLLAAVMIAVPWVVPALFNGFWVSVIAEILIWSLLAASAS
jgi:branched-chain amino acid transport system permease protein